MLVRRSGVSPETWSPSYVGDTSAKVVNEHVTFGGVRRKVQSQEFEGGSASATFGGIELDLREAASKQPEVTIAAFARFGGIEIRVPEAWDVTVSGAGIFGAFEDETNVETSAKRASVNGRTRLLVTGEAVFGGVTVKN